MKIMIIGTLTNNMNGSARSFLKLCKFLSKENEILAVLPDNQGVAKDITETDGIKKITMKYDPIRRSIKNLIQIPYQLIKIYKLIKECKPEIIHINDIPWFYIISIAKICGIPVTIHSRYYEKNVFVNKIISKQLIRSDAIIFVSNFIRDQWGFGKYNKAHILQNPGIFQFDFDYNLLEKLPSQYLLIVSRFAWEKGVLEAIKIFEELSDQSDKLDLVIAGDAQTDEQFPYKRLCEQYVLNKGLERRVHYLGNIEKPHILYTRAYGFIHLPNFEDPFPTTILEALALGCRIITNSKGGIPEQIKGFDGIFMAANNFKINDLIEFLNDSKVQYDRSAEYKKRFGNEEFIKEFEHILKVAKESNH